MFSGGAAQSMATMSRVSDNYRTRIPSLYSFFADPQNYARTLYLSIHDIALEKMAAWGQRRRDERPRVARGGIYPLTRAATTVALRELGVYLTVAEMYRGVPAIYGTFVGYDEVAHHSGPERKDTMQVLRRLDKQLARLERAARHTPRPYRIVVLSDHGQSPGTPFRQTYGETLHELIGRLAGREAAASGASTEDEGIAAVNVALTETIADQARAPARVARRALGGAVQDDAVDLAARSADPDPRRTPRRRRARPRPRRSSSSSPGVSGWSTSATSRVAPRASGSTRRWPDLVAGLIGHEGISFVMVRDEVDGAVVHVRDRQPAPLRRSGRGRRPPSRLRPARRRASATHRRLRQLPGPPDQRSLRSRAR